MDTCFHILLIRGIVVVERVERVERVKRVNRVVRDSCVWMWRYETRVFLAGSIVGRYKAR